MPRQEAMQVDCSSAELKHPVETQAHAVMGPLWQELQAKLILLDERQAGMPALVKDTVALLREEVEAASTRSMQNMIEAHVAEAFTQMREEHLPWSRVEKLVQGATTSLKDELRAMPSSSEVEAMVKAELADTLANFYCKLKLEMPTLIEERIRAAIETLRKEALNNLGTDQAIALVDQSVNKALIAQEKLTVNDVTQIVSSQVREATASVVEQMHSDVDVVHQKLLREVIAPLREDLQQVPTKCVLKQMIEVSLNEATMALRQELQQMPTERDVQQKAEVAALQAVAPLREELQQLPTVGGVEAVVEARVREATALLQEAVRRPAAAEAAEQLVKAESAFLREGILALEGKLQRTTDDQKQDTQQVVRAEVEPLHEGLAALQERMQVLVEAQERQAEQAALLHRDMAALEAELHKPKEAEAERAAEQAEEVPRSRHPLVRLVRRVLQLLSGGVVLLVALGLKYEATPKPRGTTET